MQNKGGLSQNTNTDSKKRKILKNCFLSLNYDDIIIDSALATEYYDFINLKEKNDWKRRDKDKAILLLKITWISQLAILSYM